MHNKTKRRDIRPAGPRLTHEYTYDSAYRLVRTLVNDPSPTLVRDTAYSLDGVGNRTTVTGPLDPGVYTMDPTLPEPADHQMNQYTGTPFDNRAYDRNGNLASIAGPLVAQLSFDYRNQLVGYSAQSATGEITDASYAYDVFGRRIARTVSDGTSTTTTRYFYFGEHVVEEQDTAGVTLATYVYGNGFDEVLTMQRQSPTGGTAEYFYFADDLGNVMAVARARERGQRLPSVSFGSPGSPGHVCDVGRHWLYKNH